jgi:ABC-type uncharacterized transport system fused permease/ATPase subunit
MIAGAAGSGRRQFQKALRSLWLIGTIDASDVRVVQ